MPFFPGEKLFFFFQPKNALSCRKMPFPAEKCTFLHRKMRFSGWRMAGNRRKLQEGFRAQESRALPNCRKTIFLSDHFSHFWHCGSYNYSVTRPHGCLWSLPGECHVLVADAVLPAQLKAKETLTQRTKPSKPSLYKNTNNNDDDNNNNNDNHIYICCKVSNWATFGPF